MGLKSWLIGSPLRMQQEGKERLSKILGLAILSSDALSSVAYATEQILSTLLLAGVAYLDFSLPISAAIALLIFFVAMSYAQTIHVFPAGGGAYVVAKNYLGRNSALVGAASLLIDYLMTVTVSVTAGLAALISAFPGLIAYRVPLCLVTIVILTFVNLRGVRESGKIFSVPVYAFIFSLLAMIAIGLWQPYTPVVTPHQDNYGGLMLGWILLRAFSSGCVALTGIEAVANSVQAFKPPEARNARITLVWMAAILATLFLGISYLTQKYGITPALHETVLSKVTRAVFGTHFIYYFIQFVTCLILLLAANTAYAGFPRLCSMVAADGYLPKQLTSRGDRLVYSNGIIALSIFAGLLILLFNGFTNPLIPLYTVGVFTAFTLSQAGMVRHWLQSRAKGWRRGILVNTIGAIVTALVLLIVAMTKFIYGAWMVLLAVPILISLMRKIHAHYQNVYGQLDIHSKLPLPNYRDSTALIPVSGLHKSSLNAIHYAQCLSANVQAVYVSLYPEMTKGILKEWKKYAPKVPLVVLDSPNRSIIDPIVRYIDKLQSEDPQCVVTVVMPGLVPLRWWHQLLHNQTNFYLRMTLFFKRNVVTINVPTHIQPC